VILVHLFEAKDQEVFVAQSRDKEVSLLTSDSHRMKWISSFNGVSASLEIFVPDFETPVKRARDELGVTGLCHACDGVSVCLFALELFLEHDDVIVDRNLHGGTSSRRLRCSSVHLL